MPNFTQYPESQSTKLLYLGHTGAGKTGSLCSLAAAGYNVHILDLDAGGEIIRDYITNPKSIYRNPVPNLWDKSLCDTLQDRIDYVTITEEYNIQGVKAVPKATAWHRINMQLNDWRDGDLKLGNVGTWTSQDILVFDGLSRLWEAIMNFQLSLSGHLGSGPRVGTFENNDYTAAYKYLTDFLDLLKSSAIKCNVIMICHIQYLNTNPGETNVDRFSKGFPQAGRKVSPMIGQYFNHFLLAESIGNEGAVKRSIVTNNSHNIELKNTAPLRVPREYKLETGLAEYFRDIRTPAK